MNKYKKSKSGIKWNFIINNFIYSIQILQMFLYSKYLTPSDFSLVGIVIPIVLAFFLISEFGFGSALIQKETKNINEYASSVCVLMLAISLIMSLSIILSSNIIAEFYSKPELVNLLYLVSIILVVKIYSSIITSLVIRNMDYKSECFGRLYGVCFSFVISITILIEYQSYWSVIIPYLITPLISVLYLILKFKNLRLKLYFSYTKLKEVMSFSINLFFANLIYFFSRTGISLFLAKIYETNIYGNYYFAQQISNYPRTFFSGIINKIVFSGFSTIQEDKNKLRVKFLEVGKLVTFFTSPLILVFVFNVDSVFQFVFEDKWLDAIEMLELLLFFVLISTIASVPALTLQSIGKAEIILKSNIIRVPLLVILIIFSFLSEFEIIYFLKYFVLIEIVPSFYLIYNTLKILNIRFIDFYVSYLQSSLIILFVLLLFEIFNLNVYKLHVFFTILLPFLVYIFINYFLNKKLTRNIFIMLHEIFNFDSPVKKNNS